MPDMKPYDIHLGNCLEVLKGIPDNSVDSIVTDPPYGLSFMGKKWDYDVPEQDIWEECLRVLKPGGHLLAFAGTRTQHRMAVRIEDAGFEIRDMIAWVYGSGFPKSHNLKGEWKGWGTAMKPALEPITVARKPFKGTVAANVLAHGTGALNIDGCRVGTDGSRTNSSQPRAERNGFVKGFVDGTETVIRDQGRWPANLIHDGSDIVVSAFPDAKGQQGDLKETGKARPSQGIYGDMAPPKAHNARQEEEKSAARFFYCAKTSRKDRNEGLDGFEGKTPSDKTGRKEGSVGLVGDHDNKGQTANPFANGGGISQNNHPTVKPTDLMAYLCRLVTPPGGVVLDPFMGSGSTGKAAMREGFRFIGIEMDESYLKIAEARIAHEAGK